jgi:membrane-associated protein
VIWPITVTLLGYGLGSSIKSNSIDTFILPVVLVILVISVIPLSIEILKSRRESKEGAR